MAAPMDLNSIVGSTMVTVDVGIPLAGVIATFTEGAATCWSGSGANRLGETVGTGLIAKFYSSMKMKPAQSCFPIGSLLTNLATRYRWELSL